MDRMVAIIRRLEAVDEYLTGDKRLNDGDPVWDEYAANAPFDLAYVVARLQILERQLATYAPRR